MITYFTLQCRLDSGRHFICRIICNVLTFKVFVASFLVQTLTLCTMIKFRTVRNLERKLKNLCNNSTFHILKRVIITWCMHTHIQYTLQVHTPVLLACILTISFKCMSEMYTVNPFLINRWERMEVKLSCYFLSIICICFYPRIDCTFHLCSLSMRQ